VQIQHKPTKKGHTHNLTKKTNKTPKEFRVASRAAPSRRRRRRSALCLFLSRIMAGVDLAMEGIPRYVKDLSSSFFLSFEVDAFEARHDVSNQQQHAFFDQDSTMLQCAECLFSLHAYALNVHTLLRCLLYSQTNS
jgi:hypothetical protein